MSRNNMQVVKRDGKKVTGAKDLPSTGQYPLSFAKFVADKHVEVGQHLHRSRYIA